jgi:hypothetical protein
VDAALNGGGNFVVELDVKVGRAETNATCG